MAGDKHSIDTAEPVSNSGKVSWSTDNTK